MNHTQAKARAVELGISKTVARQFGNLSKTQTWLDAITAQEAQPPSDQPENLKPVTEDLDCCPVLPLPAITIETPEEQKIVAITSEFLYPSPWVSESEITAPTAPGQPKTALVYPILLVLMLV